MVGEGACSIASPKSPSGRYPLDALTQVTPKFRVSVVPTVTFPKSRMVPLAGSNDVALAGETVRGSTPPTLRGRSTSCSDKRHAQLSWPSHPSERISAAVTRGLTTIDLRNPQLGGVCRSIFWTNDEAVPPERSSLTARRLLAVCSAGAF